MWLIFTVFLVDRSIIRVPLLNGTNFPEWKESLLLQLGLIDFDLCFQVDVALAKSIEENSEDAKVQYKKWKRSNRSSILFML